MLPAKRLFALTEIVSASPSPVVSLEELSERLQVSEQTVRRDLQKLESQGLVRRTLGGVVRVRPTQPRSEPSFENRSIAYLTYKRAIAREACALLDEGDSIFFDASSTVLELVRRVPPTLRAIVASSSLPAIAELTDHSGLQITAIGGELRAVSRCTGGAAALRQISEMRFATAFLSARAMHPVLGLTEGNADEAALKRALVANAERIVALIDSSKLNRTAPHHYADIDRIETLITDNHADGQLLADLRQRGIQVIACRIND